MQFTVQHQPAFLRERERECWLYWLASCSRATPGVRGNRKDNWPMFLFSRKMTGIEPETSCFPKEVSEDIIKNDQPLRIPAYPVCFPHLDLRWPMKSEMHVKNISKCFMNVHTPIIDIVYCIYLTSFTPNNHSQIRIDYFQVRKKERERE